ncbi:hypothetical protein JOF57_003393 [Mycolicibacterium lutetiense]|uniref:Uncharacterized protein n=1 Tax=Mycolicibacterium lutetiense TaxID=1641992 RepID=A0ABS4ZVH8_9MYCO|nr:hypothetical protein [Mycolicibacterium lutetiense]
MFPFLFISVKDYWTLAAYVLFMVFVGLILARSEVALVNPCLLLFGYNMYNANTLTGEGIIIISKSKPRAGAAIVAAPVSSQTFIAV